MLNGTDPKIVYIYNARNLTEVSKVTLAAKDTYGNEISYFSMSNLSFDGSYILASDYSNWYIFSNKFVVKRLSKLLKKQVEGSLIISTSLY